jgi:hypothetical protein
MAASVLIVSMPWTTAHATVPTPADWPQSSLITPSLDAWPNALRLFGADRYQTGLATTMTLRGSGAANSYPFGSPDPASVNGWWGLNSCPRSVIVVAGDTPADALAASSLSDATGLSSEPYLQITSSADQVFDPVGDFRRVDTDFAPILLTRSARQGATSLDVATRLAAQEMVSDGCTTAREAIVVGGTSAVPAGVDTELVSIGFERVYRIAGTSRYHTARLVAEALGTATAPGSPAPTTCTDPSATDGDARMTFHANSVIEFRDSASTCTLMNRTVVVADGVNGADALAAGWWTSFWQVPVLLHNGSDTLPDSTQAALQTLDVDNVIVLGGMSRISADVADDIAALATATVTRVSGVDRYATSVAMAERFGGWYAAGATAAGSMLCVAASTGTSGWPDALSAGPWCARATASDATAPARALPPATSATPTLTSGARTYDAVPIVLVPTGATSLPTVVADLVDGAFDPTAVWCAGTGAPAGCAMPGLAVVFGGSTTIPNVLVADVSTRAGGGASVSAERNPTLADSLYTGLDLGPVYANGATTGTVCVPRGAATQARWLFVEATASTFVDMMLNGRYQADADGTVSTPGTLAPTCAGAGDTSPITVRTVSPTGAVSNTRAIDPALSRRFTLSAPLASASPVTSTGVDSDDDMSAGGTTTWTFTMASPAETASLGGTVAALSEATTTITLTRGTNTATTTAPDTFTATFSLVTASGTVSGAASGEAILDAGTWKLRGSASFSGAWVGRGGWKVDLGAEAAGLADDTLAWRLDGLAP